MKKYRRRSGDFYKFSNKDFINKLRKRNKFSPVPVVVLYVTKEMITPLIREMTFSNEIVKTLKKQYHLFILSTENESCYLEVWYKGKNLKHDRYFFKHMENYLSLDKEIVTSEFANVYENALKNKKFHNEG